MPRVAIIVWAGKASLRCDTGRGRSSPGMLQGRLLQERDKGDRKCKDAHVRKHLAAQWIAKGQRDYQRMCTGQSDRRGCQGTVHLRSYLYRANNRFGFYSKCDEKPDRNFEQRSVIIWCLKKNYSGYWVENRQ